MSEGWMIRWAICNPPASAGRMMLLAPACLSFFVAGSSARDDTEGQIHISCGQSDDGLSDPTEAADDGVILK